MNSENKNLELAQIAFDGENYSEAYDKYSKVLENDFNNVDGWQGKGLSAAYNSDLNSIKFKECILCVNKAIKLGVDENRKLIISLHMLNAARNFIEKINDSVYDILNLKQNKPMSTGQLYSIKKFEDVSDSYATYNKHWDYFEKTLNFMSEVDNVNASLKVQKKKLSNIDFIFSLTKGHFHKDYLERLQEYRDSIIMKIKQNEPSFVAPPINIESLDKQLSSCFIATEIYGSYDNPKVRVLRKFRDEYLTKNRVGALIVKKYYEVGPKLATKISKRKRIKLIVRTLFLDNIIRILERYF